MRRMQSHHSTGQAVLTVGLVGIVASILVACSKDDPNYKPGTLPPISSSVATATSKPTDTRVTSDKDEVEAVYRGFLKHFPSAQDVPKARRRSYLAQWMTDPGLSSMVKGINKQVDSHQRIVGTYTPHIRSIRMKGRSATVSDCVDQSHFNVRDTRTGKIVSNGPDRVWTVVYMKRTAEGWRVSDPTWRRKSCTGN